MTTQDNNQMFGCSKEYLETLVTENSDNLPMLIAGMMSDAQELIGRDLHEHNDGWVDPKYANQARQLLNQIKYIVFKHMSEREVA
jgi:hypothetical protein